MGIDPKFLKPYQSQEEEPEIYRLWEESGFFNPDNLPNTDKERFSVVLPPPNVTGTLHLGHALMLAVQDALVRQKRMGGARTLWLPGTDHAAIATQSKVETTLYKKEGKSRHDLGRENFLKEVKKFAQESHDTIINQLKAMGSSLDWSREAFTLDEKRNSAVVTAFKKLHDLGLIEKGHRIVNWDPKGQTTISDDELEHEEREVILYTFKYSKDFPIGVATTRLETKIGDTAVALHPEDARYKEFIGREYKLEFCGVPLNLKIVGDESVDPEFGTGALGVTPAHSQTDWEIAKRHGLEVRPVINEYAKMTVEGELKGLKTTEARDKIAQWLRENNLLIKEEKIKQNVAKSYRSGGIIEPLLKTQWFVMVNKKFSHKAVGSKVGLETTLKSLMRSAIENGEVKIIPERFEKIYYHWIDNLRDWCISRQLWYGHRIPVYYCKNCAGIKKFYTVSVEEPKLCQECGGDDLFQDLDTLDTWFSSGLWTFSTLGWPDENAKDLKNFHPTDLMETGYDILFFWVARMILMSKALLGEAPFRTVYLHGLVRDEKGRKMSKSLGNIIDPLTMIEKYGADAVRMALLVGNAPGNDLKISEDKIKAYKHFSNKIWNVSRFVLQNCNIESLYPQSGPGVRVFAISDTDKKYLGDLGGLVKKITADIENFRLHLATEKIYHYIWHTFADVIIEESKPRLSENAPQEDRASAEQTLFTILTTCLKLLHPFMPFVTEAIWQKIPESPLKRQKLLVVESWPK